MELTTKTNSDFREVAELVKVQSKNKKDYAVTPSSVWIDRNNKLNIDDSSQTMFDMNDHFNQQISSAYKIPKQYYDRLRNEYPDLYQITVNTFLALDDNKRYIRTINGTARAFLSKRYQKIDNENVLNSLLLIIKDNLVDTGLDIETKDCSLTEKKMYIKLIDRSRDEIINTSVKANDRVFPGIILSNSEVGAGSVRIEPFIWRQVCKNGMISADVYRKYHVGGNIDEDNEHYRQATQIQMMKTVTMQMKDIILGTFFNPDWFRNECNRLEISAERKVTAKDKVKFCEVVADNFNLGKNEKNTYLENFLSEGDYSQYGTSQALTQTAQSVRSYDRRIELERKAGKFIDVSEKHWNNLNNIN